MTGELQNGHWPRMLSRSKLREEQWLHDLEPGCHVRYERCAGEVVQALVEDIDKEEWMCTVRFTAWVKSNDTTRKKQGIGPTLLGSSRAMQDVKRLTCKNVLQCSSQMSCWKTVAGQARTTYLRALPGAQDCKQLNWRNRLQKDSQVRCWTGSPRQEPGRWLKAKVESLTLATATLLTDEGGRLVIPLLSSNLQPSMKDRGMSLAQLQHFARSCIQKCKDWCVRDTRQFLDRDQRVANPDYNKQLVFEKAPTWLMVELFVKAETYAGHVPLVDMLHYLWPDLGGPATTTHFVSHSWGQIFMDGVEALQNISEDASVWMCCFALTQRHDRLELLDDSEVFAEALTSPTTIRHVLILDSDQQALQRMWVLFEIIRAHEVSKPMQIVPPGLLATSRLMRCAIEVDRASCSRQSDEIYIKGQMQKAGLSNVNAHVRTAVQNALQELLAMHDSASEDKAWSHFNLGQFLEAQGDWNEALAQHEKALHLRRYVLGNSNPDVATSLSFVARGLWRAERHDEAEVHFRKAVLIRESLFGKKHILVAEVRNHLARVLRSMGRLADAKCEHEFALEVRTATCEPDDLEVAQTRCHLACVLQDLGQLSQAEQDHRTALDVRLRKLGHEHPLVATSRDLLGVTLTLQSRFEEACVEFQLALQTRLGHFGSGHPDAAKTRLNLAAALQKQCKLTEAESNIRLAIDSLTAGPLGEEHGMVRKAHSMLLSLRGESAKTCSE